MMVEQGSEAWHQQRLGKVTASRVKDVLAKGRSGQPSASRANYLAELLIERLLLGVRAAGVGAQFAPALLGASRAARDVSTRGWE